MTDDIRLERRGAWGVVTLNRPKALNALNTQMCAALDEALAKWSADDEVRAILIEGEGEKAFCAGGDVRSVRDEAMSDPDSATGFFRTEYRMNTRIHHLKKPYVALMDGVCMGGGVGVSAGASHRVVTERTLWAMPECMIGLIPDVGASYHLKQLSGGMGNYLALTGVRMRGADCLTAGIADTLVPSEGLPALRETLLGLPLDKGDPSAAISAAMPEHNPADAGSTVHSVRDIDQHFTNIESIPSLFAQLEETGGAFGQGALEKMRPASPTSLALTHRLLRDAPESFEDCISREFDVVANIMRGHDLIEGVRAQLVDKDREPKWQPADIAAVDEAALDGYFRTPPSGPLDLSGV